jgi:serine/threonine-protein kinase
MQDALRDVRQEGNIDGDIAGTIRGKLNDINGAVRSEDAAAVRSLVGDIEGELEQAADQDELTQPGAAALEGSLTTLRQAAEAFQP